MKNEKFFDCGDFLLRNGSKRLISIPTSVFNLINEKFDIDRAYRSIKYTNEIYKDIPINRLSEAYLILDNFVANIKADEVESKYLRNREPLSPIDDLYYSYERELKYTFPDSTSFESALVSGDFSNMARLDGVPSWVISQVLEIYGDTSNDMGLSIEFEIIVNHNAIKSIKDESIIQKILYLEKSDIYNELMEILKDNNVPIEMRIQAYGYYEDGDTLIKLDTFKEDNLLIKDCGTFNNFHFDYKKIIDDIYNELHK